MKNHFFYLVSFFLLVTAFPTKAQLSVKEVSGIVSLNDFSPSERKYASITDSLDRNLKAHPNDTISLYYRALLYIQFNNFIVKPDLSSNQTTNKLLSAMKMVNRADSLKMQCFNLKVLRAQLCKELSIRYAAIETWRFNDKQLAERKKQFEYFKSLANRYYNELAFLDKPRAYDYQKLKVK